MYIKARSRELPLVCVWIRIDLLLCAVGWNGSVRPFDTFLLRFPFSNFRLVLMLMSVWLLAASCPCVVFLLVRFDPYGWLCAGSCRCRLSERLWFNGYVVVWWLIGYGYWYLLEMELLWLSLVSCKLRLCDWLWFVKTVLMLVCERVWNVMLCVGFLYQTREKLVWEIVVRFMNFWPPFGC